MGNNVRNDLLRDARERRGWTQLELAQKIEMSEKAVRSWENGERAPGLKSRYRLCEIFGMTAAELGLEQNGTGQLPQEEEQTAGMPVQHDPNRRRMLKRVQTRWISGVLDHSLLDQGTFIHLRLQECPTVVVNPWSEVAQESNLPSRSLSPETGILDVYDEADGGLLILGEPGAGKTTLLLSLARSLLARASLDEVHPMPVVFNLSSWVQKRSSLMVWLVDELNSKYHVPRSLAVSWIAENRILPLLDGLDEVAEAYRAEAVQSINVYRKDHGFVPMVVCCRASEYLALGTRIALDKAVSIEPLSWEEIVNYISKAGKNLQGVELALKSDLGLREMASTPLMLNIIAQTFRVTSIEDILSVQDEASRRALIFEKYIEIVLKRRGPKKLYLPEQTQRWLSWLARQMQQHNQTEFYLERMQPDWLLDDRARARYRNTIIRIIFGFNYIVTSALFACFRGDSAPTKLGLFFWLGAKGKGNELLEWMRLGLGGGLAGAGSLDLLMLVVASLITLIINMRRIPLLSLKAVRIGLLRGLYNGLLVGGPIAVLSGIIFGLSDGIYTGIFRGVGTGFYTALLILLITGLNATLRYGSGQDNQARLGTVDRLMSGFIFCICAMLSFAFFYWIQAGEIDLAIKYGVVVGTASVVYTFSDTMDLIRGLGMHIEPAETMMWSWRAVKGTLLTSAHKAARVTLFVLMTTVVVATCVSSLFHGIVYGLSYGLIYGLIAGLIIGITTILTQVLTNGWSSSILSKHQQIRPNWGITRSARNSLLAAFVSGPIAGILSGIAIAFAFKIAGGLAGWQILGMGFALILGIEFTLQIALAYGGIAVIEHYILRWYLWRDGDLPLNAPLFLDYAAERIILRKIGGGYMFSHRLLLDHFASIK